MDQFHERLARIGLAAGQSYGLALAGGYAIQAHGLLDRPSEDVDLFTAISYSGRIGEVADAVAAAYTADGMEVARERQGDTFTRLQVTDGRHASKVELVADLRNNEPVHLSIGQVLHLDDAVANKVSAMYDRHEARDFIDVDAAFQSGRFTRSDLIALLNRVQAGVTPELLADALSWAVRHTDAAFAEYGMYGRDLDGLRQRFAEWRRELLGG